jgi:hypothetical protein
VDLVGHSDDVSYIDIGYGKPIELSSCLEGWRDPELLIPGRHPGNAFFHTALEQNPYLMIDLEVVRPIKRIRVYNEEDLPGRATPMSILGSVDGELWSEIARVNYMFGGRRSNCPLDLRFRERLRFRYIKLMSVTHTFLHLDYVEVLARTPDRDLGRLSNIRVASPRILADYVHHDSHGFTWTFTCALSFIINCLDAGIEVVRVDFSRCMMAFKEGRSDDPYLSLFAPASNRDDVVALPYAGFQHHGIYATFDLPILKQYATAYFAPSASVMAFEHAITEKYGLVAENTLAIVYRGTDKITEVTPTPVERYIEAAQAILRANPALAVVIQTDQAQALQAVKAAFPNAIHFEEMPVTSGTTAIHGLELQRQFAVSKSMFAIRMLAITHLLAKMKYIVTHTGNIGLWLALYRGNNANFYQFDIDMNLRDPGGNIIATSNAGDWQG